jgi:hypothetical protein
MGADEMLFSDMAAILFVSYVLHILIHYAASRKIAGSSPDEMDF